MKNIQMEADFFASYYFFRLANEQKSDAKLMKNVSKKDFLLYSHLMHFEYFHISLTIYSFVQVFY